MGVLGVRVCGLEGGWVGCWRPVCGGSWVGLTGEGGFCGELGGFGDGPDAGVVVGGTGREVAHVWGEEHAGDVGGVGLKGGDGDEGGEVVVLEHAPNVDVALKGRRLVREGRKRRRKGGGMISYVVVPSAEERAVRGNGDAGDGDVILGDELVRALVLAEIPNPYVTAAVATDQLALVGMYDHVVDGAAMRVVSLHSCCASIPDLDGPVLRARYHPFPLAMERDACDVAMVAFESEEWIRVGGTDVVELDFFTASGS